MTQAVDLSKPEGTIKGYVWFTRQLTGKPLVFRGYVHTPEGETFPCMHDHRKAKTARACAAKLARMFAR